MWEAFGMGMLNKLATNLSDTYGTGKGLRDEQREEVLGDFLERERLGIQARVEGFKAAGLHPLLATGYSSGNSPASIVGGSSVPTGGTAEFAPSEKPDDSIQESNRRIGEANARKAEADATLAEVAERNAVRNLAGQPGNPPAVLSGDSRGPTSFHNLQLGGPQLKPGVSLKDDQVTAGEGGLTAGTHPAMTTYLMPDGSTWKLPSNDASQAMEDLEMLKYLAIFQANKGDMAQWALDKLNRLGDRFRNSSRENAREISSLASRYPPKGTPGKWPPRMHGGRVSDRR